MIELGDHTADVIVTALDVERVRLRAARTHRDMVGDEHADSRRHLLALERECDYAISGINTGRGVTRRDID